MLCNEKLFFIIIVHENSNVYFFIIYCKVMTYWEAMNDDPIGIYETDFT